MFCEDRSQNNNQYGRNMPEVTPTITRPNSNNIIIETIIRQAALNSVHYTEQIRLP